MPNRLNPLCSCSSSIDSTSYFLVHWFWNIRVNRFLFLLKTLFYISTSFDPETNTLVFNATIDYSLSIEKNLFFDMQFFNPCRMSFGLLNLCFLIFIYYFHSFSLFLLPGDCGVLVYCVILYSNVYRKSDVSVVQTFHSYSLFNLSSLVYVDQLIKHLAITLTCHF